MATWQPRQHLCFSATASSVFSGIGKYFDCPPMGLPSDSNFPLKPCSGAAYKAPATHLSWKHSYIPALLPCLSCQVGVLQVFFSRSSETSDQIQSQVGCCNIWMGRGVSGLDQPAFSIPWLCSVGMSSLSSLYLKVKRIQRRYQFRYKYKMTKIDLSVVLENLEININWCNICNYYYLGFSPRTY